MRRNKNKEIKLIFALLTVIFLVFLAIPVVRLLMKSFVLDGTGEFTIDNYRSVLTSRGFLRAVGNSFLVSCCSAVVTTVLDFFLAYSIHYTNLGKKYKSIISKVAVLPMLLPTITYGFAIIYSFGKQGLLTKLFGRQLFEIYGFNGLLLGYVIYTLPVSFMLINNTMGYIDKKFMIVSRLMGDSAFQTFRITILRPLLGTLAASFIQTFFLCFTDFGIPASVGGRFDVVASVLYTQMLGSIPNFGNGAVVALIMLIPSIVSITILHILEKYNVRYNRISTIELKKNKGRDIFCGIVSGVIMLSVVSVFAVIFVVPFVSEWPYNVTFTLEHVKAVFEDNALFSVYTNSLMVAAATALLGTLMAYGGALITARSTVNQKLKNAIESIALITNTIPGMVIGLAVLTGVTALGMTGCGKGKDEQVIIYSNADDEAVESMKHALDNNGYEGQYVFQTFGTSELGGKLLAEGTNIEADMVTMSTFYVDSAQEQNKMFQDLTFDVKTLDEFPSYCAPITAQEGTIIVNTEMMKENNLEMPKSLKDLAEPEYKGFISVTDVASSSTAWLLIQGLVSEYGEDGAKDVLKGIYENAGDHIEDSGSAPLKKVRAGEVAIGFGLRQQAVADKEEGLPIDFVDPEEGNFTLTESVAVVDKGEQSNPKAMEMAQCIIENGREELQSYYPVALYEGETTDAENLSGNPKTFGEPLTVDLLKEHQELSEECK